jgi:hypothetical protein
VKFKTEKNKTFAPHKQGTYDLFVDRNEKGIPIGHIDRIKEVATYAIYWGVIKRKGGWYYIGSDLKYQGIDSLLEALRANDELRDTIESETMAIATSGKSKKEVITHETAAGEEVEIDNETGEILS